MASAYRREDRPLPRKADEGFETSTGTLYVSKPYRSKSSKKLRALITFAPRKSVFDIGNETSITNEFRVRTPLSQCLCHLIRLYRVFSRFFGSPFLSSPSRVMCAASKQADGHWIFTLRPCSRKTPSPSRWVMRSLSWALGFACHLRLSSRKAGYNTIGRGWFCNMLSKPLFCFLL